MDIVLVAGLWLDGSAWDAVVPALETLGHRPVPLTLPGQGDGARSATLDEQRAAVLAAVDASPTKPLVVGHSAACTLAWLAADARPDKVARTVLIGGFPSADGQPYSSGFEIKDGVLPFPGWGPFEGPDSADLDEDTKRSIAAAHPRPRGCHYGHSSPDGRAAIRGPGRYRVPGIHPCRGPGVDRRRRRARTGQGQAPRARRHRLRSLADVQQAGRTRPAPCRSGGSRLT